MLWENPYGCSKNSVVSIVTSEYVTTEYGQIDASMSVARTLTNTQRTLRKLCENVTSKLLLLFFFFHFSRLFCGAQSALKISEDP